MTFTIAHLFTLSLSVLPFVSGDVTGGVGLRASRKLAPPIPCESFNFTVSATDKYVKADTSDPLFTAGDVFVLTVNVTDTDSTKFPIGSTGGLECTVLVAGQLPDFANQQQDCVGSLLTPNGSIFFRGIGNAPSSDGVDIGIVGGTGTYLGAFGDAVGKETSGSGLGTSLLEFIGKICG